MSIATDLTRLQTAKSSIRTALNAKLSSADQIADSDKLDTFAAKVALIETGSGGTDTSDADATAADIASGKTAYVNGEKLTGTHSCAGESFTPGYLINTSGVITFQPNAGGSAEAVSAIKTFNLPSGVNEPEYSGGGSATTFYKCATVDTTTKTWTGYKAVLSSGAYSFESTVTTGLAYTTVIPVVGYCYADGALVKANLYKGVPQEGLVIYLPLYNDTAAATGQSVTTSGNTITFQTIYGIQCGLFNASMLAVPDTTAWDSVTLSALIYPTASQTQTAAVHIGANSSNAMFKIGVNGVYSFTSTYATLDGTGNVPLTNGWHHLLSVREGSTIKTYVDGVLENTYSVNPSIASGTVYIGAQLNSSGSMVESYAGYMTAARIYNRALTAAEIALLAAEFTPAIA